ESISFAHFEFRIEALDKRRISVFDEDFFDLSSLSSAALIEKYAISDAEIAPLKNSSKIITAISIIILMEVEKSVE
ncbi:hypothetical protein MEO41_28205, partial [Dolichospermum sp. ST_sed4]|nr:hypothetical protein [Dolichospermum sp. ST_sed4]